MVQCKFYATIHNSFIISTSTCRRIFYSFHRSITRTGLVYGWNEPTVKLLVWKKYVFWLFDKFFWNDLLFFKNNNDFYIKDVQDGNSQTVLKFPGLIARLCSVSVNCTTKRYVNRNTVWSLTYALITLIPICNCCDFYAYWKIGFMLIKK